MYVYRKYDWRNEDMWNSKINWMDTSSIVFYVHIIVKFDV